jgi:TetR/AcrR family transcriptional repressor of nem operon
MKKPAQDTRQHILDVAKALMASKGYTAVGLAEVVAAAGVPKGSFYYYFKSKEEFGQALLQEYFDEYLARIDALMETPDPAITRLMAYFRQWTQNQCTASCPDSAAGAQQCLVVKLGPEVCDLSDDMRSVLRTGTDAIITRLTQCVQAGQADGSITSPMDAAALAESLYQLWLGASLLSKLGRHEEPFAAALQSTRRLLA